MKRKVIFYSIAALVALTISFYGFRYYKIKSTMGVVAPLLQNISIRVANTARYESKPTKIIFQERLEKCERDISEIESKIIDIQSMHAPFCADKLAAAIAYAQSCQELLSTLLNKNRKVIAVYASVEKSSKAIQLFLGTGFDGPEYMQKIYAEKIAAESVNELRANLKEVNEALQEVLTVIQKVDSERTKVAFLPAKSIVDASVLDDLKKKTDEDLRFMSDMERKANESRIGK
jgi:hypothetical protein